ncbi:MAG: energy coupling factor transporter S component ThiW [Clostridiales bacterium]|nr:energy coupling factor transporter S component ThiW [Clostridiales bacterium]
MEKGKKTTLAGLLVALGVSCSVLYIPIGAAKCFPVQHAVNLIAAIALGPWYGVGMAFVTSLLRVSLGMGTLLAFPGSMVGALLSGLLYRRFQRRWAAAAGELVGTGLLGAMLAYPMAAWVMGREAALFVYVIPFSVSSLGGVVLGVLLVEGLSRLLPLGRADGRV